MQKRKVDLVFEQSKMCKLTIKENVQFELHVIKNLECYSHQRNA